MPAATSGGASFEQIKKSNTIENIFNITSAVDDETVLYEDNGEKRKKNSKMR